MSRRRADAPGDAGVSLIELLVSMSLMIIVGGLALSYFTASGASTSRTTNENLADGQLRTAMTAVATMLDLADTPTARAGYSTNRFDQLTASTVTFYSNINANRTGTAARSAPTKVVLTATSTQLVQSLYAPLSPTVPTDYTQNYAATPTSTRVLVDGLASTSVFTYCAVLAPSATTCQTPATTGDSVAAVTVSLTTRPLRGESAQSLTSTIGITGALS